MGCSILSIHFMSRIIIALLVVGCCLTGYRFLDWMVTGSDQRPATLAQPAADTATAEADMAIVSRATPTVAALFLAQSTPVAPPTTEQHAPITLQPTPAPSQPVAQAQAPLYPTVVIYDDQLNASWSVEQSTKSTIDLAAQALNFQSLDAQQTLSSGAATIAVSPQADYGTLFFTVRPESGASYARQNVVGVSFWLNSGSAGIGPADLAIAVVGSNTRPYWTPDDHSVFPDNKGKFSETRLYFLKINRTIPPHTWLNLIVWLNELQYDPIYQYVTGFYLKSDAGFRSTYYLDQVSLLLAP